MTVTVRRMVVYGHGTPDGGTTVQGQCLFSYHMNITLILKKKRKPVGSNQDTPMKGSREGARKTGCEAVGSECDRRGGRGPSTGPARNEAGPAVPRRKRPSPCAPGPVATLCP